MTSDLRWHCRGLPYWSRSSRVREVYTGENLETEHIAEDIADGPIRRVNDHSAPRQGAVARTCSAMSRRKPGYWPRLPSWSLRQNPAAARWDNGRASYLVIISSRCL